MKILVIHHLEAMWEGSLEDYFETSLIEEVEKIIDHIEGSSYDKVILSRFEDGKLGDEHYDTGIAKHIDKVEVYGYGWEREAMEEQYPDEEGTVWADGGQHSEVVLLDDWIKELRDHDVSIAGAFDGECIDDLETAMEVVGVSYNRVKGLIVGDGYDYWDLKRISDKIVSSKKVGISI